MSRRFCAVGVRGTAYRRHPPQRPHPPRSHCRGFGHSPAASLYQGSLSISFSSTADPSFPDPPKSAPQFHLLIPTSDMFKPFRNIFSLLGTSTCPVEVANREKILQVCASGDICPRPLRRILLSACPSLFCGWR